MFDPSPWCFWLSVCLSVAIAIAIARASCLMPCLAMPANASFRVRRVRPDESEEWRTRRAGWLRFLKSLNAV
ncbi:hypothetical protein IWZ03DRAFT_367495 [Phyllosticta citriasiana]|uniref:Secreted protein n=1 Tax=Phyllosticta citriasiana TaxID=595635 RepID=A0ABR1L0S2_9PEZI